MPDPLILASGSTIRARLLRDAGVAFDVRPVAVDEEAMRAALTQERATPRDIADALAEMKALRAAGRAPGSLVLGCDQILAIGTEVFGKAADRDEAHAQLMRLQGRTHQLLSAAVLVENGRPVWRKVGVARLTMHALIAAEIDAYLDRAWPEVAPCVGCYQVEALGVRLFAHIDGDYFSILGLPLVDLLSYLRLRGSLPA
ncbi:MAG: septum formation protein Maf [Limimaricola sp.]|uniref:Maf family protein n=1 Tax=Limimaricola sp. TaxID=2211665 RepID=UPI001DC660B1|nr:nucleoside triphosphate pyrophosphatase [Limimaricola sp.]MBI1417222.1 septum formation protein Maf [Limimaricola sp.]